MDKFLMVVSICSGLSSIIALLLVFIKPLREHVFGIKAIRDGQKCMLRSDMLATYYRHSATEELRQYEKENFILEYKAYKALGGNSFIDDIYERVRKWDVKT